MAKYHSLTADQVKAGDRLPELRYRVTPMTIIQGAIATRDWQPQHHDHAWAVRVGTKDIFMNTPTQGGWISRFLSDWAGPTMRLARLSYKMRSSIYPAALMTINGTVTKVYTDATGCNWVDLAVEIKCDNTVCTVIKATVALPQKAGAESPWKRSPDRWQVGELPAFAASKA